MFKKLIKDLNRSKDLGEFERKWITLMANLKLYNELKQTFSLNNLVKAKYGYKADILIVAGLNSKQLEEKRIYIEDFYGCMFVFNKAKRCNIIHAEFIFNIDKKIEFKIIKAKPTEIYLANTYSNESILLDVVKYPHLLITGGTRSGKSKLMDCILTNLIVNCSRFELELYLVQVAKSDLVLYENCKQTRAFADNLEKTLILLQHIDKKMLDRNNLIKPLRQEAKADNYLDYNKVNPLNELSTVYVVFDEMSSLFQVKGDNKEAKKLKEEIISLIRRIAQFGAGLGVFLICSLQRPTADNLDPFIRSQCTCIISFRQNNSKSSEIVLDDGQMALGLEQREFIYYTNKHNYGIVPLVNNKKIYNYIKPKLETKHRDLFRDLKKQKYRNCIPVDFTKVDKDLVKTKEDKLKENISKISNFVPYTQPKHGREKVK
ncbi:FtsK/SpoIIIE domain-containing protein [Clostridium brassicae]|uniref:FtsK/SpoIIIE domain-containing protein n=1 Tax=Clostridium brassicae TaxID=2999072 RepID=A0ABT4D6Q9_9CLOT|nr:FtsK/SpoIIIE domain-containing protein [Clostridium brassicae]MCY6957977.1 FtsK/SpoIIIE domain-containing protein [Clostridium brassicae]